MAICNYQLKAGVLLQAFSDASKTCTSANLTDELAEFHLKRDPSCARFFSIMPGRADIPDEIRNPKQPGPTIIVPPEKAVEVKADEIIEEVIEEPEVKIRKKRVASKSTK